MLIVYFTRLKTERNPAALCDQFLYFNPPIKTKREGMYQQDYSRLTRGV